MIWIQFRVNSNVYQCPQSRGSCSFSHYNIRTGSCCLNNNGIKYIAPSWYDCSCFSLLLSPFSYIQLYSVRMFSRNCSSKPWNILHMTKISSDSISTWVPKYSSFTGLLFPRENKERFSKNRNGSSLRKETYAGLSTYPCIHSYVTIFNEWLS